MIPGENWEVVISDPYNIPTPNGQAGAFKDDTQISDITIVPTYEYREDYKSYPTKLRITTTEETQLGSYNIKYCSSGSGGTQYWMNSGITLVMVTEHSSSSGEGEGGAEQPSGETTQTGNMQPQSVEAILKVVEESPAPIYIPKTPEEIYRDELALCYPHGYAFVKAGNKELLQTSSKDGLTSSVYYAGTKLGSFSVKAADGTIKKLHIYDTIVTADGRVYLQVWVNTNDGQAVSLDLTEADRAALKENGISGVYVNKTALDL